MSKKNLVVAFLLLSGVAITLAYAAGSRSNWLTDNQINFSDKHTSEHGNKVTAVVWDAVMNGLTTWAQNHERRLQAFAQSSGYPNLDDHQTSFADLLSTKHNNMLTAEMWNGLVVKLTTVITNHEMRLRKIESTVSPAPILPRVDGKCGITAGTCAAGTPTSDNKQSCGTRTWSCQGSNGGINQSCSKILSPCSSPIDGVCGVVPGTCKSGTVRVDNRLTACGTIRIWSCQGNDGGKEKQCSHENDGWKRKYRKTECILLPFPVCDNPDELISVKFSGKGCEACPFGTLSSRQGSRIKSTTYYCKNSLGDRGPACKKHTSSYRNRMGGGIVHAHSEDYGWSYTDNIQIRPFQDYCDGLKNL